MIIDKEKIKRKLKGQKLLEFEAALELNKYEKCTEDQLISLL